MVPFWGRCTTSSGDWDVHWGLTDLGFDPRRGQLQPEAPFQSSCRPAEGRPRSVSGHRPRAPAARQPGVLTVDACLINTPFKKSGGGVGGGESGGGGGDPVFRPCFSFWCLFVPKKTEWLGGGEKARSSLGWPEAPGRPKEIGDPRLEENNTDKNLSNQRRVSIKAVQAKSGASIEKPGTKRARRAFPKLLA